jgi:quinol monooxygenase YgiN
LEGVIAMVLHVTKWDVHPDKVEAYSKWVGGAVQRLVAAPGVIEFRAYRGAAGAPNIVSTFEFADMAAWAAWQGHEETQKVLAELRTLALNVSIEVWGPSPLVTAPVRPGN